MRTRQLLAAFFLLHTIEVSAADFPQPADSFSPNRQVHVANVADPPRFEIVDHHGHVLVSAADLLDGAFSMLADRVRWSPDSKFVAISVQVAHHGGATLLFYLSDHNAKQIELPEYGCEKYEFSFCHPDRWTDKRVLRLSVSSSNRQGHTCEFFVTLRVSEKPPRVRELERSRMELSNQ